MIKGIMKKIVGSRYAREVKRLGPLVDEINGHYAALEALSEEELRAKTQEFKDRIAAKTQEILDEIEVLRGRKRTAADSDEREELSVEISRLEEHYRARLADALEETLPEAFAVVKAACRCLMGRKVKVTGQTLEWDMIPYDVQLIGAIQLHRGRVAEMATGEGKTLVATMPLYLNALAGRGAHLVTVNSYLAQRDAEWMGAIYSLLDLTVDCIDLHEPGTPERRDAYNADITYGTNNEFGFDYLRDNMVHTLEQRVQRAHHYAIIDEVDSILIDEARTPLIISGPVTRDTSTPFKQMAPVVGGLHRKQSRMVNRLVAEAVRALGSEGDEYAAGEKLLAAKRGGPKNKRLMKLFADQPGVVKVVQKVEGDYMREKRLHEVDEMLFFAMDEKGSNVHLSDAGLDELSPGDPAAFVVPDLSEVIGDIQEDEELSVEEKRARMGGARGRVRRQVPAHPRHSPAAQGVHALPQGRALHHRRERGHRNRRRVHRKADAGTPLERRAASGGRGQGRGGDTGETQTLATITIQNYFRMYDKLAGMDRDGGNGGDRVSSDLQPRCLGDSHQPTHRPGRPG